MRHCFMTRNPRLMNTLLEQSNVLSILYNKRSQIGTANLKGFLCRLVIDTKTDEFVKYLVMVVM